MASTYITVTGLRELGEKLSGLENEVKLRLARKAIGKGANGVKKVIVQKAPVAAQPYVHQGQEVTPGNIGRNVIVKRLPQGQTQLTAESIVTIRSKRKNAEARRVATFFEFGTVKLQPKPFFRSGFDESKDDAVQIIADELRKGIEEKARE